ncbi:MAG: hypothetical protein U1D68_12150 [Arthrobacter sp.]|nr:hypothetical protein [Arthrobacter sp.]MDZ4353800.1 hypothetical protein [Arthrobacter sp.]
MEDNQGLNRGPRCGTSKGPAQEEGDEFRGLIAMCGAAIDQVPEPTGAAELLEAIGRLDELSAAMDVVTARLEVAVILRSAPIFTSGMGTSPMATEAADRLRLAINNVVALRET